MDKDKIPEKGDIVTRGVEFHIPRQEDRDRVLLGFANSGYWTKSLESIVRVSGLTRLLGDDIEVNPDT